MNRSPQQLIDAMLDGSATPDEIAALGQWIAASPENADRFARQSMLHGHTRSLLLAGDVTAQPIEPIAPHAARAPFKIAPVAIALAAALLLTAAVVAVFVLTAGGSGGDAPAMGPAVATLVNVTGGGNVFYDETIASSGNAYASGVYALESGTAELLLTSGATIQMHGATRVRINGPMGMALSDGQVTVRCPAGAEGFAVRLPGGDRVIDLGTEFDIRIADDGATEVRVFEGAVEIVRQTVTLGLSAGDAVALEPGAAIRPIDNVLAVARSPHDPVDTPTLVGQPSVYPSAENRFAAEHLFDQQIAGVGADYAGEGPGPHDLVIDLGIATNVRGLRVAHRVDSNDWRVDRIGRLELTFSDTPEFADAYDVAITPDRDRRDAQDFAFAVHRARYVRVRLFGHDNAMNPGAAMLLPLGEPAPDPPTERESDR